MNNNHPHLAPMKLLSAKEGTCPECATDHPPHLPHNQQSLFYQYDFFGKHGRWPTWADAMAHCDQKMKDSWIAELGKIGIQVPGVLPAAS
jgi:hypothetical protein